MITKGMKVRIEDGEGQNLGHGSLQSVGKIATIIVPRTHISTLMVEGLGVRSCINDFLSPILTQKCLEERY